MLKLKLFVCFVSNICFLFFVCCPCNTYLVPRHKQRSSHWMEWWALELQGNCTAAIDKYIKPIRDEQKEMILINPEWEFRSYSYYRTIYILTRSKWKIQSFRKSNKLSQIECDEWSRVWRIIRKAYVFWFSFSRNYDLKCLCLQSVESQSCHSCIYTVWFVSHAKRYTYRQNRAVDMRM